MPKDLQLARLSVDDDAKELTDKVNSNMLKVDQALKAAMGGWYLSPSKCSESLLPTDPTSEFYDIIYPVGCVIMTMRSSDPRLSRGTWTQVAAGSSITGAATEADAGTTTYGTYYSLFMDNSSIESQVTAYLLSSTLTIDGTEYSYGPVQIAAILANIRWESNFSVGELGDDVGGGNLGLFSFADSGMRQPFLRWCEQNNYDPYTVQSQMDYVFTTGTGGSWWTSSNWIPNNWSSYVGNPGRCDMDAQAFMEEDDVEVATFSWMASFERCGYAADTSHLSYRVEAANEYYNALVADYSPTSALSSPVVARAFQELGKPYEWGATGPSTFDCSGLVSYCLCGTYGVRLGTTETFMTWPQVTDPQPGDICTTMTHCGIYIGLEGQLGDYALRDDDGNLSLPESTPMMINAPHSGDVVRIAQVQSAMIYVRYQGDVGAFTGNNTGSDSFGTNGYSTGMYVSQSTSYSVLFYERIA